MWETQEGDEIEISELTDSHIMNIGRYFHKRYVYDNRAFMLDEVAREAKKRGLDYRCHYKDADELPDISDTF